MPKIKSALLSTFYKDGLEILAAALHQWQVEMISTGGTLLWLRQQGYEAQPVEDLTAFPEMLGGRVKTLHPKIFGGILHQRDKSADNKQVEEFGIPTIDLVVVNLYPFEETLTLGASHAEIIEKIDIGGVALIRAAAKNYQDVAIVADPSDYEKVAHELQTHHGTISEKTRKYLAVKAFQITASYDAAISRYLQSDENQSIFPEIWVQSWKPAQFLRYGENPHQKAAFYGATSDVLEQIYGKELSYNNLVDVDASIDLLEEFGIDIPTTVIVKHTNACGVATGDPLSVAYTRALACDPVSAFGGVIAVNRQVEAETAILLNDLFFEVLTAPGFDEEALEILKAKKNRILLINKGIKRPTFQVKSVLNGLLVQQRDHTIATKETCTVVTTLHPGENDWENLLFANKIVKHTKSNTIVLARNGQLIASGTGQTSRVDALKQAIHKAKAFGFDLNGCAMASDAFFPFPDCVEIAAAEGITSVIQPGGSIKDQDSINACNQLGMSMIFSGIRHFKH